MKHWSLPNFIMAVICVTVLCYFGLQGYQYFNQSQKTVEAYEYCVEETTAVNGYIIRDEHVLPDDGSGLLRLTRAEGEKVGIGDTVAVRYSDKEALDRQNKLDKLIRQQEQLMYAKQTVAGSEGSLRLDLQIMEQIVAMRQAIEADKPETMEEHISSLEALITKRDYTYASPENVDSKMTALSKQIRELSAKSGGMMKKIKASVPGLYSAVVDGYETVLKPENIASLKPSSLQKIKADPAVSSAVGKLILGDDWTYVVTMREKDAEELRIGSRKTLRLAKGIDRNLTAHVSMISEPENGQVLVAFTGDRYLSELTMLRKQTADIINRRVTGIRIPENALRVNENGETGLYCLIGKRVRFKPVKVIYTGEDFILVQPNAERELYQFRAGDQVVISAGKTYNGKVVE